MCSAVRVFKMGQKVNPISFRLGVSRPWRARWFFADGRYKQSLKEDQAIREFIYKNYRQAFIEEVEIERSADMIRIIIHTARPGFLIGRRGKEIDSLRKNLEKIVRKTRRLYSHSTPNQPRALKEIRQFKIDIQEVRRPETRAKTLALMIALDLERRLPYRRVIKTALEKVSLTNNIKGVKIKISGRLGGAEIARSELVKKGSIPLGTLRADIDYAQETAYTKHGVVGVKVWIYKGERFDS